MTGEVSLKIDLNFNSPNRIKVLARNESLKSYPPVELTFFFLSLFSPHRLKRMMRTKRLNKMVSNRRIRLIRLQPKFRLASVDT